MPRKLELRGQRFGRLTVIDKIEKKAQKRQYQRLPRGYSFKKRAIQSFHRLQGKEIPCGNL